MPIIEAYKILLIAVVGRRGYRGNNVKVDVQFGADCTKKRLIRNCGSSVIYGFSAILHIVVCGWTYRL